MKPFLGGSPDDPFRMLSPNIPPEENIGGRRCRRGVPFASTPLPHQKIRKIYELLAKG